MPALEWAEGWTTTATAPWCEREWEKSAGPVTPDGAVTIEIPGDATGCFVNLVDPRRLTVSTELVVMD